MATVISEQSQENMEYVRALLWLRQPGFSAALESAVEELERELEGTCGDAMAEGQVRVRRAYEKPDLGDGTRVLVDRIWPRGLTKAKAALDEWCKDVAPSDELRKWYGHDPARFEEFGRRYRLELQDPKQAEALAHLRALAKDRTLTLLTATRQADISEAAVLATLLQS
jgi:uncharacterized protein YeaO (DUF488 family)